MANVYVNRLGKEVEKPRFIWATKDRLGILTLISALRDTDEDYDRTRIIQAMDCDMHPSDLMILLEQLDLFDPENLLWVAFKIGRQRDAFPTKKYVDVHLGGHIVNNF